MDERKGVRTSILEDRMILIASIIFFLMTAMFLAVPLIITIWPRELGVGTPWHMAFTGIAALLAFALIRTLRVGRKDVIPSQDKALLDDLLRQSPHPLDEYVKLSGLIGTTGLFRKLEFSGMPLATILMTLVLCALSVGSHAANNYLQAKIPDTVATGFFELAKLTLGAFIGSFVARPQAADERRAGTAVATAALPGGAMVQAGNAP